MNVYLIFFWIFFVGFAPMDALASKYNFQWKFSLGNSSYESETESSVISKLTIQNRFIYLINSKLGTKAQASLNLGTGRSQSRFGDIAPVNSISLSEAYIFWKPLSFLRFHVGALNQNYLNTPLLVDQRAFPAIMTQLRWKKNKFSSKIILQKALPSSITLSTRAIEKEPTPVFETQTLNLKFPLTAKILAHGFITHYKFKNLPNTVIEESHFYGNTIYYLGKGSLVNQFFYPFVGFTYGGHLQTRFGKSLRIDLGGYIIENTKAPASYKFGQEIFSKIKYKKNDHIYSLKLNSFFNESDTSPAFYNSSHLGHNNRQGYSIALGFKQKEMGFNIFAGYTKSYLINPSSVQEDQSYYFAKLETEYENI